MTLKFFTIKPRGCMLLSKLMCSTFFRIISSMPTSITIDGSPTACGPRRMRLTILQLAPRNSMHSQNLAARTAISQTTLGRVAARTLQLNGRVHSMQLAPWCANVLSPPLDAREIKTCKQDLQLAPRPQEINVAMQLAPHCVAPCSP